MAYIDLTNELSDYNWDDGFAVPRQILMAADCDLALQIFYMADGFSYEDLHSANKHGILFVELRR